MCAFYIVQKSQHFSLLEACNEQSGDVLGCWTFMQIRSNLLDSKMDGKEREKESIK